MELGPGTLIGGRYRLERLLGRGGMGEVWAAKHTVTRRDMALKFLNVDQGVMTQMRRRFLREARAATAVSHPNVIQIHDVFELEDETPVMVMDLLTGEALGDKLAREGALSVDETAQLMVPVVSAVGTAHAAGIVHRDIKPENIFLCHGEGGEIEVKVLDFGIAKLAHAVELDQTGAVTGTGAVLGTPYYMALEQAYGEKDIDHRADIWSLGVVMYECLAGRRPIEGDNFGQIVKFLSHGIIPPLHEIAPHVPADVCQLVARMLQRAREDRPADLREVLSVLRRYSTTQARTFAGPQAPQTSGVHDAPNAKKADVVTVRERAPTPPRGADPGVETVEVVSAERPTSSPSLKISTGKKASSADVTLAESAAAMPASVPAQPVAPSHRPALLIAAGGAVVGIALTAAFALTMTPRGRGPETHPTSAASGPLTSGANGATVVPETASAAAIKTAAPTMTVEPAGSMSADPAAPSGSASATRPLKLGPLATAKPAVSGAPTAKPATTVTPKQPKGGLVDEPPF